MKELILAKRVLEINFGKKLNYIEKIKKINNFDEKYQFWK